MQHDEINSQIQHKSLVRFIVEKVVDNAAGFFFDWFVTVPGAYIKAVKRGFVDWEKSWAMVVTAKFWLKPMWQDFSIPGYVIGFFLRTFRILFAGIFYVFYFALAAAGIMAWYAVPVGIGYLIVRNLFFFI